MGASGKPGAVHERLRTRHDLERDSLVARDVFPTKPPSVEYPLTSLGEAIIGPLSALVDWALIAAKLRSGARAAHDDCL